MVIAACRHYCRIMAQRITTISTLTPISTSTLPMFLKTSRKAAPVRQYRPVHCHLQVRTSPLRARFARHVVRNTLSKTLIYPNEIFLTSPIQTASHFISQTNKDHGRDLASRNKPLLHGSTRHCNDILCRQIFPFEESRTPGRRNVLHSGNHCTGRTKTPPRFGSHSALRPTEDIRPTRAGTVRPFSVSPTDRPCHRESSKPT
jgi:hypothetical protein